MGRTLGRAVAVWKGGEEEVLMLMSLVPGCGLGEEEGG